MKKTDEKIEVPKLSQEVKKMNGKSGHRLSQCIDALCEILDEDQNSKQTEAQEQVPAYNQHIRDGNKPRTQPTSSPEPYTQDGQQQFCKAKYCWMSLYQDIDDWVKFSSAVICTML